METSKPPLPSDLQACRSGPNALPVPLLLPQRPHWDLGRRACVAASRPAPSLGSFPALSPPPSLPAAALCMPPSVSLPGVPLARSWPSERSHGRCQGAPLPAGEGPVVPWPAPLAAAGLWPLAFDTSPSPVFRAPELWASALGATFPALLTWLSCLSRHPKPPSRQGLSPTPPSARSYLQLALPLSSGPGLFSQGQGLGP